MKKTSKVVSLSLIFILIFNVVAYAQVQNPSTVINLVESEQINENTTKSSIRAGELDVEILDTGDTVITTSYLNGVIQSETVTDKATGKLTTTDKNGQVEINYVSDFIEKVKTETLSSDSQNISTLSSDDYQYITSAYNSGVKQTGYLYGKKEITYGETYEMSFGTGAKVSTIVGAIAGLLTGGGLIAAILMALGTTIVSDAITTAIDGKVFGRYTRWDYKVESQGKVGLITYQTTVDAKVINSKTGDSEWVYLRTEGDERSLEDLCIIGAYNVAMDL